jgi:hypothetical protein
MARDRANINTNLWVDADWRSLDDAEQRLYMLLMTHPSLSYAGVADWRPGRLAAMSRNGSREGIELAAKGLQSQRFVFIDEATEEILIRSFLRHDGLLKQPKLAVSMANAFGAVASREIQMIIVNELHRLHSEHAEWKAFEVAQVKGLLKLEGKDMSSFTHGFTPSFTLPLTPKPAQAQALPTSTATTTATSSNEEKKISTPNRKSSCPKEFPITEAMAVWAAENKIVADLKEQTERFLDHHASKGSTFVDWTRAWQNWMRNAKEWAKPQQDPGAIVPAGYAWANR